MLLEAVNEKLNLRLVIEHDAYVGYYLYAYHLDSPGAFADYLCDDLEDAFFEAKERYNITRDQFVENN